MYNITKSNDLILGKFSDSQTDCWTDRKMDRQKDRQTDRQMNSLMEKSDFIGRCPTNVKHPIAT